MITFDLKLFHGCILITYADVQATITVEQPHPEALPEFNGNKLLHPLNETEIQSGPLHRVLLQEDWTGQTTAIHHSLQSAAQLEKEKEPLAGMQIGPTEHTASHPASFPQYKVTCMSHPVVFVTSTGGGG